MQFKRRHWMAMVLEVTDCLKTANLPTFCVGALHFNVDVCWWVITQCTAPAPQALTNEPVIICIWDDWQFGVCVLNSDIATQLLEAPPPPTYPVSNIRPAFLYWGDFLARKIWWIDAAHAFCHSKYFKNAPLPGTNYSAGLLEDVFFPFYITYRTNQMTQI